MDNIVNATFKPESGNVVYTKKQYQYNRNTKLRISGIALPEKYQVHFSNGEEQGVAAALWVSGSDISIPDAFFETGDYIHVWICFAEDDKDGGACKSEYKVVIPIERRPAILRVDSNSGGLVINARLDNDDHTLIFG